MTKKILVFSDMHGDKRAVDVAKTLASKEGIDLVVYLGDFSSNIGDAKENLDDAGYLIGQLKEVAEVKTLFGNCDVPELGRFLEKEGLSLHNQIMRIGRTLVIGFGGSSPTPFHTPSEFSEKDIEDAMEKLIDEAARREAERLIIFSHVPPKNTKADEIPGGHAGSTALRSIIDKYQPNLCVCGHIHEAKGTDFVKKTKVVNVGPAKDGNFLIVEVDGKIETREIKL